VSIKLDISEWYDSDPIIGYIIDPTNFIKIEFGTTLETKL